MPNQSRFLFLKSYTSTTALENTLAKCRAQDLIT